MLYVNESGLYSLILDSKLESARRFKRWVTSEVLPAIQRGPVGLLSMLPREFTREQVRELRIVQGMKPDPRVMINNWLTRRLISRDDERGLFVQA